MSQKVQVTKARMLDNQTPFAIKEAYNQLRTSLMYTSKGEGICPVYAVTSAEASDGKSTIISNLAVSFAQANKKVLLIDADMRRPVQHQHFDLSRKRTGLSELLSSIAKYDASLVANPMPYLYVLTSGAIPPNPSELLLGEKLEELLTIWRKEFDVIFIDLPPVDIVSDPLSVSPLIDGYILAVRANKTDSRHLHSAVAKLKQINAKLLGVVLTATNFKSEKGYKYKYKYYRNKYEYVSS